MKIEYLRDIANRTPLGYFRLGGTYPMPTSENEKEFVRVLTNPRHNPKADRNLDLYFDILRKFEADKTDEELDALTDAEYEAITSELFRQAGLSESDQGDLLEAWMARGDVKVEIRTID